MSLLDTTTHGDEDGTEKESYHDEEHAGIITIPAIAVHYRKKIITGITLQGVPWRC